MSPEVEAAIIAGGVGVLTVIVALYGTRRTSQDTRDGLNKQLTEQREALDRTLKEQREALDRTLKEQREALDRTLKEQGEALDRTLAEQRARTLNERFATAADQLGSDKPAVQLAGVYAMAGLADDWEENRQTCVKVLCAYLRMPYKPDPGQDAPEPQRLKFEAIREVRHAVIKVIAAHLKAAHLKKDAKDAVVSWQGLEFDFTGAIFDGGDFRDAEFSDSPVVFDRAEFCGGEVRFNDAAFSGRYVFFGRAKFSGGTVRFDRATFSGSAVSFRNAEFCGGEVRFNDARFSGGQVYFSGAQFSGTTVDFNGAQFSGGTVNFGRVQFPKGAAVDGAQFSGGTVSFVGASFSRSGVTFDGAQFSGGTVDFNGASDWSSPPRFPWTDTLPSGVRLPKKEDQSQG